MPTLLDRLRDDDPARQFESSDEYVVDRRHMRDIVQRDLSLLLNTTNISDQLQSALYPEACASTINFGVPSLAGTFLVARRWEDIHQIVRTAILDFEPRIIKSSLAVLPLEVFDGAKHHNHLAFEVRGHIHMDPYPLEFQVQSSLDLDTSRISITSVRGISA